MCLTWPVRVWHGSGDISVADRMGRSRLSVFLICLFTNMLPKDMARFRLLDPQRSGTIDDWIGDYEFVVLMSALRKSSPVWGGKWTDVVNDKLEFARFCAEHGLSHPDPIAAWDADGKMVGVGIETVDPINLGDIVVKPRRLSTGRGVSLWEKVNGTSNRWSSGSSGPVPVQSVFAHAEALSRFGGGAVLQPRKHLDPALQVPGVTGMPHARMIVGTSVDGSISLLGCYFRLPPEGSFASNAGLAGQLLRIDPDTGELGLPRIETDQSRNIPADLIGVCLPNWSEAVDMLVAGQGRLPKGAIALGWDVIFTIDGPFVLEANFAFPVSFEQIAEGRPIADSDFAGLLSEWIELTKL